MDGPDRSNTDGKSTRERASARVGRGVARVGVRFAACAVGVLGCSLGVALAAAEQPSSPESQAEFDREVRERRAAREAARQEPAEAADRRATRRRFANQSSGEAHSTARHHLGAHVTKPPLRPFAKRPPIKFLSDSAALVEVDGARAILSASAPLGVRDESGRRMPMDLSLEPRGDGFAPARQVGQLRFPQRLEEGVALGDIGVTLRPTDAAEAADGAVIGGAVLYANAHRDADFAVRPAADGIEVFDVLRSEESPEILRLEVRGSDAIRIRQAAGQTDVTEILRGDRVVAHIGGVQAADADGIEVDSEIRVVAPNQLEIEVRHREEDLRYPITVDPGVTFDNYAWESFPAERGSYANPPAGWALYPAVPQGPRWYPHVGYNYLGWGLHFWKNWDPNVVHSFQHKEWVEWFYDPPGDSSLGPVYAIYDLDLAPGHPPMCVETGFLNLQHQWVTNHTTECHEEAFNRESHLSGNKVDPNLWTFRMVVEGTANRIQFAAHLEYVNMEIWDNKPPTVSFPTGWGPTTRTVTGHDSGTGVEKIEVQGAATATAVRGCDDTHNHTARVYDNALCAAASLGVSATYAEGANSVEGRATDTTANVSLAVAPGTNGWVPGKIKVDTTPPRAPTFAGLAAHAAVGAGQHSISAVGSDDTSRAPVVSGARTVEASLGGEAEGHGVAPSACLDNCTTTATFGLNASPPEPAVGEDDFNGSTSGTSLESRTPQRGGPWQRAASSTAGAALTAAGRVRQSSEGENLTTLVASPPSADYDVSADVVAVGEPAPAAAADQVGVVGRMDPATGNYYAAAYADGIWTLTAHVNGADRFLGDWREPLAVGATARVTLRLRGSKVMLVRNGVARVTATDTAISAAGRGGVLFEGKSNRDEAAGRQLDNFKIAVRRFGEGSYPLTARATDGVGLTSPLASQQLIVDWTPPELVLVAGSLKRERVGRGKYDLNITARDPGVWPAIAGMQRIEVFVNDVREHDAARPTPGQEQTTRFEFDTTNRRPGSYRIRVLAYDAAKAPGGGDGNLPDEETFTVIVDDTPPEVTLSGGATRPLNPGPDLVVHANDRINGVDGTGIKSVEVQVDGIRDGKLHEPECDPNGCPQTWDVAHDIDVSKYDERVHTLKAIVKDLAGNQTESTVVQVYVSEIQGVDRSKLGLEDYLDYRSVETGAGSRLHVNAATGNVVWHSTPIVNPGRGLSSVLNLTYNSHDRGGVLSSMIRDSGVPIVAPDLADLVGVAYGEVGHGFSIAISGLTRLNEPLAGVRDPLPGRVIMTDPDGTAHTFTDPERDGVFREPAGVHLRLRRFSNTDPAKRWAITRPDGVTFYFDADGYATTIQDRNDNIIRFDYQHYSKVTGDPCTPVVPIDPKVLCAKRVVAVVDPYGVQHGSRAAERSLKIAYNSGGILPVGSNPGTLRPELLAIGGAPGRVKSITDHANRATEFTYRDGYLIRVTQGVVGADRSQERSFRLDYTTGDPSAGYPGHDPHRHLESVTDPNGHATALQYDAAPDPGPVGSLGREVKEITERRHQTSEDPSATFDFAVRSGAPGTTMTVHDRLGREWLHHVGVQGRPEELVNPLGTRTVLVWDLDNNVERLTRAAGTADEAITRMTYNAHGQLTSQTDAEQRPTSLSYRASSGTQRATAVSDGSASFVSDLERITPPRGNWTEFGLDERGNVLSRKVKDQPAARTAYGAHGVITDEWDELGNHTAFCSVSPCVAGDFDAHGMPYTRRDPRGKLWAYEYDPVGNVKKATDPRGVATAQSPDDYATVLDYDRFDRVTRTVTPKLSSAGVFVTRRFAYDANGNVLSAEDGNGATQRTAYTPMDEPRREESPPVAHHGEDGAAPEVSVLEYDDVGRLRKRTEPNGERTDDPDDFTTTYRYDAADRMIVTTRHNTQPSEGTQSALVTSMAYDRRGNVLGVVDAAGNVSGDPVANAVDPARQRFTYTYDKTDNRRTAVEDPAGLKLKTEFLYDPNENIEHEIAPRGFAENDTAKFTTTYGRDANDLVTRVTRGARVTTYGRRADGRIVDRVAPKGNATTTVGDHTTRYDYYPTGELKSWTLPDADGQYGRTGVKVEYGRNDVGDAETITDARAGKFTNTFFDTGELRTTGRPSWWKFTGDGEDQPSGQDAELDPLVANASRTGAEVQERLPSEWLSDDGGGALPSGEGAGDFGAVERQPLPGVLPRAGATSFGYDGEMRLSTVTVAASTTKLNRDAVGRIVSREQPFDAGRPIITAYSFDRNGNLRETVDGEGEATRLEYDQFDRVLAEDAPGALAAAPDPSAPPAASPRERMLRRYDPNGNALAVVSARGLTTSMTYDEADRLRSETDPEGAVTRIDYDAHGNRTLERRPLGNTGSTPDDRYATRFTYDAFDAPLTETDGLGNPTSFEYDANGNQVKVTEPGAAPTPEGNPGWNVITRSYDGRDRLWKETVHGDQLRTTITEHDPHGNLRRVVKPAGVIEGALPTPAAADAALQDGAPTEAASRNATVYEYSADNLRTAEWLPTGDRDGEDRVSYQRTFTHDARGRVEAIEAPFAAGRQRTTRTTYTHYDTGWIKTQIDHEYPRIGGAAVAKLHFTYDYDRRGDQTAWRTTESGRDVRRTYYPNGMLRTRTARSAEDSERRYSYGYSPNRQMVQMTDWHLSRTTTLRRDGADRPLAVDEGWSGGGDTVFRYDRDGNVLHQWTDGEYRGDFGDGMPNFAGGKRTSFEYDPLDRETRTRVSQSGQSRERVTTSAYWPSGALRERTKSNGTLEAFGYFGDGSAALRRRDPRAAGEPTEETTYAYDRNGNRSRDERGDHTYNSRDQLVRWQRAQNLPALDVLYEYNGSGAVTRKTENGTTRDYVMEGDRLVEERVGPTTVQAYIHDADGNVERIEALLQGSTTYEYDGFGRMVLAHGLETGGVRLNYGYDGLDRRDFFCRNSLTAVGDCEDGTRYDLRYVGMTEALSRERPTDAARSIATYDYDSAGERLGQDMMPSNDPAAGTYSAFDSDANGSTVGLEDDDGSIARGGANSTAYDLDPFGETRNEAQLGTTARNNPFRFQGFYYDAGIQAYDMHARPYRPDIGRFLTADRFESALGDFNLQSDALTQNRYAFAGGNPVNHIEWDGHKPIPPKNTPPPNPGPAVHREARQLQGAGRRNDSPVFGNARKLAEHFHKHVKINKEFRRRTTLREYLRNAQNLVRKGLKETHVGANEEIHVYRKSSGEVMIYNKTTNEFLALNKTGHIKTYFRPAEKWHYWANQVTEWENKSRRHPGMRKIVRGRGQIVFPHGIGGRATI